MEKEKLIHRKQLLLAENGRINEKLLVQLLPLINIRRKANKRNYITKERNTSSAKLIKN